MLTTLILFAAGYKNICAAQVSLYSTNFNNSTGWTTNNANWTVKTDVVSSAYSGSSGGNNLQFLNNTTSSTLTYANNLSTVGYENITVLWAGRLTNVVAINVVLSWSTDGITWNNVPFTNVTNNATWALVNNGVRISLPSGAADIQNLRLRLTTTASATGANTSYRIDDFSVQGCASISQLPNSNIISNFRFSGNAIDETGNNNGTLQNSPALSADRFNFANRSYYFNGTSQYVSTAKSFENPNNFSTSIWFKTSTTTGGLLIGFGNAQTGSSGSHDRKIYMNNAGQIYFGVYTGSTVTINSPLSYNDNNWHLATATLSATAGMVLYIDGVQVASNSNTVAENFTGYWRIGYDNMSGWPSSPTSYYFRGSLDDALVYHTALNSSQAAILYNSPDGAGNTSPACIGSPITLTATSISGASYYWTGPNGFTSTLQNPTFIYNASNSGVYTVQVTSGSCTSTAYTNVKTVAPNSVIAYNGSPYCKSANTATVNLSGVSGGTYSSTAGLNINATTGEVNLAASTEGTYTVSYNVAGSCAATTSITISPAPVAPSVVSPLNYCLNATAAQLTATGTNLNWTTGSTSGTAGGTGVLSAATYVDNSYSNKKLRFTTMSPAVTISSVNYYIPSYQSVTGLVLALYNSSGSVIAISPTTTTQSAGASAVTISNVFNYNLAAAGDYSIGIYSGTGNIGNANTSYPITEATGTINVTGVSIEGYRCFNNIQFSKNGSSIAPTPHTNTAGTTNYTVSQAINGCVSPAATIAVIVTAPPTTANAGVNQSVAASCGTPSVTLAGNTPVSGTGNWSIISGAGGTITSPTSPTSTFSGVPGTTYTLRWTISNGPCTPSSDDVIITLNQYAASTDNQAAAGVNSWIGHLYDGTNFSTYIGQFTEAETFNELFGGGSCFNVYSNSVTRSVNTETFSVKFRMNSTKKGLYVVNLGSDDGSRLTIDGNLVYNNWVDQAFISRPSVLISLTGSSSLLYEFYENGGNNQVVFQNMNLVLANNLSSNTSQSFCIGNTGSVISGDVFGSLPAGISLSGTGYQWTYSTTPGGARTNISGATAATFTPSASVAPFNNPGTYYIYRNASVNSSNNISPNPYTAINESNAAVITVTALPSATILYNGSPYCNSDGTSQPVTRTGTSGGVYSSTAGLSINELTGEIIPATSVPGNYIITYTMAATGGCAAQTATTSITITAEPFAEISYSSSPYQVSAGTASVNFSGTTGGVYSSTPGLVLDPSSGAITLNASTPGTYTVTYSIAATGGCSIFTASADITIVTTTKIFTGTGNFSDPARWSEGTLPTAGQNLVIDGQCTIDNSVSTDNIAYGSLTIGTSASRSLNWIPGGTNRLNVSELNAGTVASNLDMSNGGVLILRGNWASTNLTFSPGAGTIELQSSLTLPAAYDTYNHITVNGAGITVNYSRAITINGNLTITEGALRSNNFNTSIKGNWINNESLSAFIAGTSTVSFNGSNIQSIGGSSATTFSNLTIANSTTSVNLNVNAIITGNLSVTNKTLDLGSYTMNRATSGGTISIANNAVLKIGGTKSFPANFTTNNLAIASTVEYYGTNQTVSARTYGHLILSSNSGDVIKIVEATPFTISGNFETTSGSGTSLTFTAASILTINGNVSIGTNTIFNGGDYIHNIAGNWVNNGTFNGSTGTINFSGPGKKVSGPGTQNFHNVTVSASLFNFSGESISVSGNLATTSSGSFIQESGGSILMTGIGKTISGTGMSVDNLTISGTVTTSASFDLTGNLSVSGSFTASNGSINMKGSGKTISGTGAKVFSGLMIEGSVITDAAFTIANSLNVSGSFSGTAGTATFTGSSTLSGTAHLYNVTINGTSLQLTANSYLGIASSLIVSAGTLNVTSSMPNTVDFNGSMAQNINAISYNNLRLSNGNNKTAAGNIIVYRDLTIGPGTTFTASSYIHSIYGDWINNGTFNAGSSTVEFLGPANAQISGATNFNILTSNTSFNSTVLLLNDNVSASIVNMTRGIISTGSDTLTITNTRTGTGYIYGHITRSHNFSTGVSYAFEGPNNTVSFSTVSGVNSITVSIVQSALSDFPFGNAIGRYYNLSVPSGTYNATLRLHYEDNELNGNPENEMGLWKDSSLQWIPRGKTAFDTAANYIEQSGLTDITNRWTCSINPSVVLWNGSVSSDWNTPDNWTVYVGSGSRPPSATDVVSIGGIPFTHQPQITTSVTIKNLVFSSNQSVTLAMGNGGSLIVGDVQGVWETDMVHTINTNAQTVTINGNMLLSDGVAGHDINLNIGSGNVSITGTLIQKGSAELNFIGAGTLNLFNNYDHESGPFNPGNGTVVYNGNQNQQVARLNYNNLIINKSGGIAFVDSVVNVAGDLLLSAGELENLSTINITGNVTIASGATLQNKYMVHVGGNWNNEGAFIESGSHVVFNGSGTQTISQTTFNNLEFDKPAASLVLLTGAVTIKGNLLGRSGTLDIGNYFFNRDVVGGSATMLDSATLIIGANNAPNKFATYSMSPNSTIIFNGTETQHLLLPGMMYGNIVFRNSGNKILYNPTTVKGSLTIENGSSFNAGSQTITLNGNWTNNGTFTPSGSTIVCTGIDKTISGVTTFNRFSAYGSYTFLSNLTFDSLLIINSGGALYAASNIEVTMNGNLVNSGILSNLGTTTFTGNVLQTLSLINAVQTIAITVNFNGSISPLLNSTSAPQFGFLNINNTGGVNPSVGWTVAYGLTIGEGASFNGGISTHNLLGNVTNNGTITSDGHLNFIPSNPVNIILGNNFSSTGLVNFGGTGAITLGDHPLSFHDVEISNSNVSGVNPISDWIIRNNFTINSGSKFNAGSRTYSIGGSIFNNGIVNSGTSTFSFNGEKDQEVNSMIFYNLDAMNSGGVVRLLDATINNDLSVSSGTLSIGNNEIQRNIHVEGNILIGSGTKLNVDTASNSTHLLTVSGHIINNGILNLRTDVNSLANLTFNSSGLQTISGSGDICSFNKIVIDKADTDTSFLDVTATNFSASNGFLSLIKGSFNLNSPTAEITPFTSDISNGNYLIPATSGLWINQGTINSTNMNWSIAGTVKVTGGTMNLGNAVNNEVIPRSGAHLIVSGGNLNLASRISNAGAAWMFSMNGGIMTINTKGSSVSGIAPFNMDAASCTFSMTGGTMVLKDPGGSLGQNLGYKNLSVAGTGFTGGTLQIGNSLTTASSIFGLISARPVYNLSVNSNNATAILQVPVLEVSNNVSVIAGKLNIDSLTLKIGGAITSNSSFIVSKGTIEMNGTSAQSIPAEAFQENNLKALVISNLAGVSLEGAINLTDVLTISQGTLTSNGYLTLKSTATSTARVAPVTSLSPTPVIGNVIAERYVPGMRRYRLMTSPVTTSTKDILNPGEEAQSIWGNWQNGGNNITTNRGTFITGGSSADGFDPQTPNSSLYTYNDSTRLYVRYSTSNGKNTQYSPLKAGVAYYMFVYGDRTNTITTSSPKNTTLSATGTLLTGDQVYTANSSIPLSDVAGRYTLLGNPFASPINWATIEKTNIENTYWGWDPNLAGTGGYITVTTNGDVTLQAPFTGNTGLNQYIQSGQGFFVKTSAASPMLVIREQDKVSNFNGNAFGTGASQSTNNISLLAVNLQYPNGANKVVADGVLVAFDQSFSKTAGSEDATKMLNSAESVAIQNDTTSLIIDARPMPLSNDTVYLTVGKLNRPQYTLQIFAQKMVESGVSAYLQDNYLKTLQPLSLSDTNNIVINTNTTIPASVDANRFRIVFQSSLINLPVKYTSVKAAQKEQNIQVTWEIEEESNIQKYVVEHSENGISFKKSGEVKATGNVNSKTYQWLDENPFIGNNYYRIRAVQTDGKYIMSNVVLVKLNKVKSVITIYPNPVKNQQINVHSKYLEKGQYQVEVFDGRGRKVINETVKHPGGILHTIIRPNKELTAGTYFLKITGLTEQHNQTIFIE